MDDERPYQWVFDGSNSLGVAATVTMLRGVSADAIVAAFGGDPEHVWHAVPGMLGRPAPDSDHTDEARASVWLAQVGEWTLVSEDNGYRCTESDMIASLGADQQVSVYWNVNGRSDFLYAERGEVVAYCHDDFDPAARRGTDPSRLDQWLHALPLVPDPFVEEAAYIGPSEVGLLVTERITGQRLTEETFSGPQTLFTLHDEMRTDIQVGFWPFDDD